MNSLSYVRIISSIFNNYKVNIWKSNIQSPVSWNILRKCFFFILYNTIYSYPSVSSDTIHLHRFKLCICLCKKKRAVHTHKIVPFNKPLSCDRYTLLEDNLLEKFSNSVDMLEIDEWSLVWRIVELTETVRQKIGLPRTAQFHGFRFYLGIAKKGFAQGLDTPSDSECSDIIRHTRILQNIYANAVFCSCTFVREHDW